VVLVFSCRVLCGVVLVVCVCVNCFSSFSPLTRNPNPNPSPSPNPNPYPPGSRSSLTCRLSGLPIDESNRPLVTPSGHVYSEAALKRLEATSTIRGAFLDPLTGEVVSTSALRRAYFL